MSDEIRYAQTEDLPALRAIWDVCFNDPRIWADWFFEHCVDLNNVLCLTEQNEIVSCVHMLPRQMQFRGVPVSVGFIVGAATLPKARNRGCMGRLLVASFHEMRRRGYVFSYLYPFSHAYYAKFGYAVMNDALYCNIPYGQKLNKPDSGYLVEHPNEGVQRNALWSCYHSFAQGFSGMVLRDSALFSLRIGEHLLEAGEVSTVKRKATVRGYALIRSLEDRVEIPELVFRDEAALHALLHGALSACEGRDIECVLPLNSVPFLELHSIKHHMKPYGMLRLLNVEKALPQLCKLADTVFSVKDDLMSDNDGVFTHTGMRSGSRTDLHMDAATLTQWLCGYRTLEELKNAGQLELKSGADFQKLDAQMKRQLTYVFEQY